MNQPLPPDPVLADFMRSLDQTTAELEYITLLLNKSMGLPVWFH